MVTSGVSIDCETVSQYTLTVTACRTAAATTITTAAAGDVCTANITTSLTINVLDVNDNSPQFDDVSYSVTLRGDDVMQVTAVDHDASPLNSLVTYYLDSVSLPPHSVLGGRANTLGGLMFTVDALSGWVRVATSRLSQVDGQVVLTIVAEDHGDPVRSNRTTVLVDVRSQRPQITSPPNNVTVLVQQVRSPTDYRIV